MASSSSQRSSSDLPSELDAAHLRRRALEVIALLVVIGLAFLLTPGLGQVRHHIRDADWGWLAAAIVLEFLSGMSYVVMFRPIFCKTMTWRAANELSWSELAMGSIVPASGAGGLALGAWVLTHEGMDPDYVARRSVAFFLIKSAVNFVAVTVLGVVMFVGVGPHKTWALTILPAILSLAIMALVAAIPRLGHGDDPGEGAGRLRRFWFHARHALTDGVTEAIMILRSGNPRVYAGTIGYWAFDNAVLWATFKAFGASPPITVILMGYLIGQLGGALPIPGGIGGIDGGLLGTLVLFGTPAAVTTVAVLTYRVILFWLPLLLGAIAFPMLRKGINDPGRPDLCRGSDPDGRGAGIAHA
jgi:uncharacterized membrane protein YbhN (UPF0104 family)